MELICNQLFKKHNAMKKEANNSYNKHLLQCKFEKYWLDLLRCVLHCTKWNCNPMFLYVSLSDLQSINSLIVIQLVPKVSPFLGEQLSGDIKLLMFSILF